MDKKVTKKMLQDLISEEIESLSEEETDGVSEGIMDRFGAWRAGRKRKKDVEQWEAFKGNLAHKLNQLAKSHQKGFTDITKDIASGGDAFKAFATTFQPWVKAVEGITAQIKGLEDAAKAVQRTPVEVSPDETPEQAGDRLSGGEDEQPNVQRRETTPTNQPDVTSPDGQDNDDRELGDDVDVAGSAQQESRRRTIKKAQKLLKENKKIKVVKSNGRKK